MDQRFKFSASARIEHESNLGPDLRNIVYKGILEEEIPDDSMTSAYLIVLQSNTSRTDKVKVAYVKFTFDSFLFKGDLLYS